MATATVTPTDTPVPPTDTPTATETPPPTNTPVPTPTNTPTPTATATPCPDNDCDGVDPDDDNDGCADEEELLGAPAPKPGSTGAYDPLAWYDFYDVPVPARPDPVPNGGRNKAVNLGDVLAVLFYAGTSATGWCGDNLNPNWVDYDCDKGIDLNGDTVEDIPPDGVPDGHDYDRSPGPLPNPPWDAGPASGAVNMQDVLAALAQVGLQCAGPP
jgi:hypothetical protein